MPETLPGDPATAVSKRACQQYAAMVLPITATRQRLSRYLRGEGIRGSIYGAVNQAVEGTYKLSYTSIVVAIASCEDIAVEKGLARRGREHQGRRCVINVRASS